MRPCVYDGTLPDVGKCGLSALKDSDICFVHYVWTVITGYEMNGNWAFKVKIVDPEPADFVKERVDNGLVS